MNRSGFAVDVNYIYRYYGNFDQAFTQRSATDPTLVTSADYIASTYTRPARWPARAATR